MRLTTLGLIVLGIAVAACLVLGSMYVGGVDVLSRIGIDRGEHLTEVEYSEHWDVLDFILGGESATLGQKTFSVYVVRRGQDRACIGRIERALRRCRLTDPKPALLTGRVMRIKSSRGKVRYIAMDPDDRRGIMWVEYARFHSRRLYDLLDESNLGRHRLADREWTVPKKAELASSYFGDGM